MIATKWRCEVKRLAKSSTRRAWVAHRCPPLQEQDGLGGCGIENGCRPVSNCTSGELRRHAHLSRKRSSLRMAPAFIQSTAACSSVHNVIGGALLPVCSSARRVRQGGNQKPKRNGVCSALHLSCDLHRRGVARTMRDHDLVYADGVAQLGRSRPRDAAQRFRRAGPHADA
jgi:hypothetical protein